MMRIVCIFTMLAILYGCSKSATFQYNSSNTMKLHTYNLKLDESHLYINEGNYKAYLRFTEDELALSIYLKSSLDSTKQDAFYVLSKEPGIESYGYLNDISINLQPADSRDEYILTAKLNGSGISGIIYGATPEDGWSKVTLIVPDQPYRFHVTTFILNFNNTVQVNGPIEGLGLYHQLVHKELMKLNGQDWFFRFEGK